MHVKYFADRNMTEKALSLSFSVIADRKALNTFLFLFLKFFPFEQIANKLNTLQTNLNLIEHIANNPLICYSI